MNKPVGQQVEIDTVRMRVNVCVCVVWSMTDYDQQQNQTIQAILSMKTSHIHGPKQLAGPASKVD